jgi:hypothetical protein
MTLRLGRSAWLVLLFLSAQFVPGLHSALEAGHDAHSCCSHEERAAHFETCDFNHEDAHCPVCDAARGPASVSADIQTFSIARLSLPAAPAADVEVADPFHVDTPHTRGPPA